MKNKIFALLLAVLMVIPFGAVSSVGISADNAAPEKIEIPAEPQPYRDVVVYVSYQATSGVQSSDSNTGLSADQLLATFGSGVFTDGMIGITGGMVVIPGKGYIGSNYTFKKTQNPVTVTAFDPKLNTKYTGTLEVAPEKEGDPYTNGTQTGMFMIYSSRVLTIEGDTIFENIPIIERTETGGAGKPYAHTGTSVISVANGGKLVVKEDCEVLKMSDAPESVIVNVDAGGYAYIHTLGFEKFTGDGIVVMDKALFESDKVTDDLFIEFRGAVVDTDGTILLGEAPELPSEEEEEEGNSSGETTKKPAQDTKKPTTTQKSDVTTAASTDSTNDQPADFPIAIVIGGVAAAIVVAVVVIIIIKKKKA